MKKLSELEIVKAILKKPWGEDKGIFTNAIVGMELARCDAGVLTAVVAHLNLAMYTMELYASDEQKAKYYPKMMSFETLAGWGLTERDVGSDASSLQTLVTPSQGGFVLNGNKRWIGNSNGHIMTVWARNSETKKIQCFIVPLDSKGVSIKIIKNKLPLRIV
mmetsp:Transcript_34954/g.31506  ORF Transcript_34954/g.31506 Transcript_34954/m.31506 type:complete len:162 (+) Transcript_34954:262-747(+)